MASSTKQRNFCIYFCGTKISSPTHYLLLLLVVTVTVFQPIDSSMSFEDDPAISRQPNYRKGDFESLSNAVYDVSADTSRYHRAIPSSSSGSINNNNGGSKFPKPRRLTIKVEDSASSFMQCGGFSSGNKGTCCSACFQLNYRRGCYCRSWDCLCFDS